MKRTVTAYQNELDHVDEAFEAMQLGLIRKDLAKIISDYSSCKSDPSCPAAYTLFIMHQVFENKTGGLDINRLVAAKKYLEQTSEDNSEYQVFRKLVDRFVVQAVFLADNNSAKSAVDYVKACQPQGGKMDKYDCNALLEALDKHANSIRNRIQGKSDGEKEVLMLEEGLKILKALRTTETFAAPKSKGASTTFRANDDFGEILKDCQGNLNEAKQKVKEEKAAAKEQKKGNNLGI